MTATDADTYFKIGQRHQIYQRPISQEDPEDVAELVKCLRTYKAFDYYGVIVEEWMVRFDGETDTYRRVVTKLK